MTERNETHVVYKAVADFSDLYKKARTANASLRRLETTQKRVNADSLKQQRATTTATTAAAKAQRAYNLTLDARNRAQTKAAALAQRAAKAAQTQATATKQAAAATRSGVSALQSHARAARTATVQQTALNRAMRATGTDGGRASRTLKDVNKDMNNTRAAAGGAVGGINRVLNGFRRFGNWRPRLTPPFVALIPILGAVLAAINPLVSMLGAAGGAVIGFANTLGSLSGVALALPGIFSAVAAGIIGMVTAMSGVGGVFKAFGDLQKQRGVAGGGGGVSAADRADQLAAAEERVRRAQRNVLRAQKDLNKAREQALRDLIALRLEVSRASLNEERGIANLEAARENYNNVLADPESTRADKLDAAVSVKEAEAELADVRRQNAENQKELAEAERAGVNGSEIVIDAQERLQDAYREVREAERDLARTRRGDAGGVSALTTATNAYEEALAKLSPSARTFVLGLLGMRDAWDALRRNVQEAFFSQFVGDLGLIRGLLPTIESLLVKAARAMGRFVDGFIKLISQPDFKADLEIIGSSNEVVLNNLGDAVLNLIDMLRHLMVAAAPFTEWLTGALAEGAGNFRDLVKSGRETGQLAKWLEKVRDRLQQWWRVIKNVGATLFNYGSAASGFGDWILDGLEKITEGWKNASEEALLPGSGFQTWLEDIKPVLTELRGLLGDFFGWFAEEASEQSNLDSTVDLLQLIRNDLGPAVAGLLDTLAATEIDEKFVAAFSRIVESLDAIFEAGGSAGLETFFDIVVGFFEALESLVTAIPPELLKPLLSILGALAALSFIGKFTGLTSLFTGLMGLFGKSSDVKTVSTLLDKFKSLDKLKFGGFVAMLGSFTAFLGAAVAAEKLKEWAASKAADATNSTPEAEELRKRTGQSESETWWDIFLGVLLGHNSNQQGTINPSIAGKNEGMWGLPTGSGSRAPSPFGMSASGGAGAIEERMRGQNSAANTEAVRTAIMQIFGPIAPAILGGFRAVWSVLSGGWNLLMGIGRSIWLGIQSGWNTLMIVGRTIWTTITTLWSGFIGGLRTAWGIVTSAAGRIWSGIQTAWSTVTRVAGSIWANVSRWWSQVVSGAGRVFGNVSRWWGQLLTDIGRWFSSIPQGIVDTVGRALSGLGSWLGSLFGWGGGYVGGPRPQRSTGGARLTGQNSGLTMSSGGPVYLAGGGQAKLQKFQGSQMRPVGTDTVPAMLTPGEFVIRKAVVDSIGVGNLSALNSGAMTYQDMLSAAMKAQSGMPKDKAKLTDVSFFSGGGLAGAASRIPSAANAGIRTALAATSRSMIVDQRTVIEKLEVNNPVPERASQSLTRRLREVSYYGSRAKVPEDA